MRTLFLAIVAIGVLSNAACTPTRCTSAVECGETETCVAALHSCRKTCTEPIQCSGKFQCLEVATAQRACVDPNELPKAPAVVSTDTTLGMQCYSPRNDGVSSPTELLGQCGDGAPLCNSAFGGDSALPYYTCTTECDKDTDCATHAPDTCTGDCKAAFENLVCFPRQPLGSDEIRLGKVRDSSGRNMTLYCRPRLFGYSVPKRCATDTDCGAAGARSGSTCTPSGDGAGACLSGHLGMYECCQRAGECEFAPGGNAAQALFCEPALNGLSGYCTKGCSVDADCQAPAIPGAPATASCWTTQFVETDIPGQCRVETNPQPSCRPTTKPAIPSPATKLVACDYVDKPIDVVGNAYDPLVRRCRR